MARQFQGYARGRGFRQRDPGYASLARQREQDNLVIRNLKEELEDKQRRDQQYINDLQRIDQKQSLNRSEIKAFEDKAFSVQQQAIDRNYQRQIDNIKTEGENAIKASQQLGAFSKTLLTTATDFIKAKTDADTKAQFVSSILNDLDAFTPKEDDFNKELTLRQGSEQWEKISDNLSELPEPARQQWRSDNPSYEVDRLDIRINNAIQEVSTFVDYGSFAERTRKLVKDYDLYGVNKVKLYPLAKKLQSQRLALQIKEQEILAKDNSANIINLATQRVLAQRTPESINNLYYAISRGTADGKTRNGFSYANEEIFGKDSLLASTAISKDTLNDWLDSPHPAPQFKGQTWRQRFGQRSLELLNLREKDYVQKSEQAVKVDKARQRENYTQLEGQLIQAAQNPEGFNYDSFAPLIEEADLSKEQKQRLTEEAFDMSRQGAAQDALIKEIEFNLNNGRSIDELVPFLRGSDKAKYVDILNKQTTRLAEAGIPTESKLRSKFTAFAKDQLGKETIVENDKSYITAGEDAYDQYIQRRKNYATEMSLEAAHRKAEGEIIELIQSGKGKFALSKEASGKAKKYSYYSPDGGYYEDIIKTNGAEALALVTRRNEATRDTFLIDQKTLKDIYNNIKTKTPYRLPYVYERLSARGYTKILQDQLDLLSETYPEAYPSIKAPLTYQEFLAEQANDPAVKRFMQTVQTQQEVRQAGVLANLDNFRDQRFMAPRVAQADQAFMDRANEYLDYMLTDLKVPSQNHALGLLVNMIRESTLDPTAPSGDDGGPGGLWQYKGVRQTDRVRRLVEAGDWKGQIRYALFEEAESLAGRPGLVQEFLNQEFASPQEAADWWMINWERPADITHGSQRHATILKRF